MTYKKPVFRLEGGQFVIETSREIIQLSASVEDHKDKIARSPGLAKSVKRAFEAVNEDERVEGVALIR